MSLETPQLPDPAPGRRRARFPRFMKLVRRIHLITGILLVPWVLLFGVTAFLFNHPELGPGRERIPLSPELIEGTPFAEEFRADALVREALEQVNAERESEDRVALVAHGPIDLARSVSIRASGPESNLGLRYDPLRREGSLSHRNRQARPDAAPFHTKNLQLEGCPDAKAWSRAAKTVFARAGHEAERASLRSGPTLSFPVAHAGRRWQASLDLGRGVLSARPADAPPSLGLRNFLLRLHTAHVYPDAFGARWIWAVLVDLMAVTMVFWALSGLLMGWQIRRLRRLCTALALIGVTAAAFLFAFMHQEFVG